MVLKSSPEVDFLDFRLSQSLPHRKKKEQRKSLLFLFAVLRTIIHWRGIPLQTTLRRDAPKQHTTTNKGATQMSCSFILLPNSGLIHIHLYTPMNHLLPGMYERILVVTAQQMKVAMAMMGIAAHTGSRGFATSPPITSFAMGAR